MVAPLVLFSSFRMKEKYVSEDLAFWNKIAGKYAALFNAHDTENLYDFYADDAALVLEPGYALQKNEEMKAGIKQYFADLAPVLTVDVQHAYRAGDVALMIVNYTLSTTADGVTSKKEGVATDVAIKDENGEWRYGIDNHYGTELTA